MGLVVERRAHRLVWCGVAIYAPTPEVSEMMTKTGVLCVIVASMPFPAPNRLHLQASTSELVPLSNYFFLSFSRFS